MLVAIDLVGGEFSHSTSIPLRLHRWTIEVVAESLYTLKGFPPSLLTLIVVGFQYIFVGEGGEL